MDTHSTPNDKIRKTRIKIVVYVLMLMILQVKTKACTMVKYKRSGSLTFMVLRFSFSIAIGLMQSREVGASRVSKTHHSSVLYSRHNKQKT
jgi:hypothetical protein